LATLTGSKSSGQLGLGDREDQTATRTAPATLGPERFGGSPVLMVACGAEHTVTVTEEGRVFTFGQLGLGDRNDRDAPVEVEPARFGGVRIAAAAAAGGLHTGVVTLDGRVVPGRGACGQLGHNDEQDGHHQHRTPPGDTEVTGYLNRAHDPTNLVADLANMTAVNNSMLGLATKL
jgi:alpha-tubulin suppressor-like RCC1 family protein